MCVYKEVRVMNSFALTFQGEVCLQHGLRQSTAVLTHLMLPCPAPTSPGCRVACKTLEERYSPWALRAGRGIAWQTAPFSGIGT